MTNDDVSTILRNIGYLIQIQGDSSFRARIYDRAAEAIDTLTVDVTQLAEQGTLQSIASVGKAIEEKIIEMLETGRCKFYDNLIQEMGEEVLDLLAIRGVGVKTVGRFYQEICGTTDLHIGTYDSSEEALLETRPEKIRKASVKSKEELWDLMEKHIPEKFINEGLRMVDFGSA